MGNYTFKQLVDVTQVLQLLESHHTLTGMTYAILDTNEIPLIAAGWQDICVRFHRQNPVSCERCHESDAFIKAHLHDFKEGFLEYRCKNGLNDAALPIFIDGNHLATFFIGQFFYDDELPDRDYFRKQGNELGFDVADYLDALERVPVFSRDHIQNNLLFLRNMMEVLARTGFSSLKLAREVAERKRMEKILHTREQEFRALAENTLDLIFRYDRNCRRIYVNPAVERFFGRSADTMLGKSPEELMLIGATANAVQMQCIKEVLATGRHIEREMAFVASDGKPQYALNSYAPEWGPDGEVASVLSILRDITARKNDEKLLCQREQEFRTLVENSPDCIVRYDWDCRRTYVNPAFEKLTGKPAAMLLGKTPSEVSASNAKIGLQAHQAIKRVLAEGIPMEIELSWEEKTKRIRCHQVSLVPEFDHDGAVVSVLSNARDISEIRTYQQQLHDLAFFDPLTGLSNRAMFNERLLLNLTEAARREQCLGLMFLDLDHFKVVNDLFGHNVGDRILREAGVRIRSTVRDFDTVARLGGDEFAVILPEIRKPEDLGRVAGKIRDAFAEPFLVNGEEQFITISCGVTFSPLDGTDMVELMQQAHMAMYHTKSLGRNGLQFYSQALTLQVTERQELENGLRKAVAQNELELYYQPKVTLPTGKIVGAEALLRWNHPERGLVPPDRFIGIAEDSGQIVSVGEWVLRNACLTACKWNRAAATPLKIAVNMSSKQFTSSDIVAIVRSMLKETGCRPEWLEIEITESLLMENNDSNLQVLEALHNMGITLAIDDFGTGYSSLGYITRFPIDTLKIDRSFINDITSNPDSAELARVIISMANCLHLDLVAEGVETSAQASYLETCGCRLAQGYFFGKPMPREQFEAAFKKTLPAKYCASMKI